ncbi:MAG: alpha/beta hydrolase [Bacteroidota bacterium]
MKLKISTVLIAVSVLTLACAQTNEFKLEEISDISYYNNGTADSIYTKVNIVLPAGVEKPPVLMWLGGGAWAYVDRHQQMDFCRKIAKKGIVVIAVGHRLSPALLDGRPKRETGIQHPEHIKDVAKAFEWIYKNEDQHNYDNNNIFVGGYSCGAHLSALLASDKKYLEALGLKTEVIKGIIPVAGGYDIPLYKKLLAEIDSNYVTNHINPVFGESHEAHLEASPVSYAENLTLPILLINEGQTYVYNGKFESEILKNGNKEFQVISLYDHTHLSLWNELSNENASVNRDLITSFIFKYKTAAK